jgi:L,D-transpeptidase ErfK/SrfK
VATTVLPGPDNPLGDFFVRLSFPGIGLHGTTAPSSIYQSVTHGCIRLHPDDIAALYEDVRVGTPGEIVYEPILLARTADGIVLETHPDVYKRGPADGLTFVKGQVSAAGWTDAIDWRSVQSLLSSRDGSPRLISMAPSDEW